MQRVGKSTRGVDIEVAVISSPANLAKLDDYKKIRELFAASLRKKVAAAM